MRSNLKGIFDSLGGSIRSLRPWQEKFSDYWEKCSNKDLIGIGTCTGSGKTLIGLLILEQGRRDNKAGVYLTHTHQLMDRISREAKALNIPHIILGGATGVIDDMWRERKKQIYDYSRFKHIIISNYSAFLYTPDFPHNIDYLVIDDVDLFYEHLRQYFTVKIKNQGDSRDVYNQIIETLSKRNYLIIKKIKENIASFYDGDLLFPYDYSTIEKIIKDNMDILRKINDFYYPYLVSREFLDYYFWFLNNNELSIEPYIFPINEIKIPKTQIKRFKNIKKIILLSATLGAPERFVVELGLFRNQIKLIFDDDFKKDGIIIKMGEKLVLPIVESDLKEEHPINIEFINKSIKYIGKLATEFDKILILCWQMKEKEIIKNKLESKIKTKSSHKFFDFIRSNYICH